jgi:exopolysaccharide biosynthesis protein
MVIHVITVDLRASGVALLVTPGDPEAGESLAARTTGQFLEEFELQVAINGDGCTPWYSNHILDYYPHPGDPIQPVGFAASKGTVYSQDTDAEPTIFLSRANQVTFSSPGGKVYNAISGNLMLIEKGFSQVDPQRSSGEDTPQPRTALAVEKGNRRLILVVVDGRQPNYSEGATLAELAGILLAHGGYTGMNLDGGGSSTVVIEGETGRPQVLNSPIDQGIPGRQRAVCNHLGIYAQPAGD